MLNHQNRDPQNVLSLEQQLRMPNRICLGRILGIYITTYLDIQQCTESPRRIGCSFERHTER